MDRCSLPCRVLIVIRVARATLLPARLSRQAKRYLRCCGCYWALYAIAAILPCANSALGHLIGSQVGVPGISGPEYLTVYERDNQSEQVLVPDSYSIP